MVSKLSRSILRQINGLLQIIYHPTSPSSKRWLTANKVAGITTITSTDLKCPHHPSVLLPPSSTTLKATSDANSISSFSKCSHNNNINTSSINYSIQTRRSSRRFRRWASRQTGEGGRARVHEEGRTRTWAELSIGWRIWKWTRTHRALKTGKAEEKAAESGLKLRPFSATKVRSSAPSSKSLLLGNVVVEQNEAEIA